MVTVEIIRPEKFNDMKPYWDKLQCGEDMSPFQSYFWYNQLNNQCLVADAGKNVNFYLVAKKDDKPVMIAPVHLVKHGITFKGFGVEKGAYILGTSTHTDYLNFIYKDFDAEAFEAIMKKIRSEFRVDTFHFEEIIENTQLDKYLGSKSEKSNCATCVEILPKDDFEIYKKSLSKSVRQNLRTAMNRAVKDGFELSIDVEEKISAELAKKLYKIYQGRTASKNAVDRGSVKDMLITAYYQRYNQKLQQRLDKYNYLINAMSADGGNNLVIVIKANDEPIGFCYGLRTEDKISIMVVSFDEEYSKYSPGMVGIFKYLESSYENGAPIFDLTRGNEQYKYKLGGTEHYLNYYNIKL